MSTAVRFPNEVRVLSEEPYNIEGVLASYCFYRDTKHAEKVIDLALELSPSSLKGHRLNRFHGNPERHHATVLWSHDGEAHVAEILVDENLRPLGYLVQLPLADLVFTIAGDHIPIPRFPIESEMGQRWIDFVLKQ